MEEIEPERWPEPIRKFVDQVAGEAKELLVAVRYGEIKATGLGFDLVSLPPVSMWIVSLACECCKLARVWRLTGPQPLAKDAPVDVPEAFKELFA